MFFAKIPRHTRQNAITEGDLECILTRNCEGTEQLPFMIGNQQRIKTVQTDIYKAYQLHRFLLLFCYFNELTVVKSMVETTFGDQFIVITLFNNTSVLHN